ncbi:hypothetical protein ANO14919_093160 [Xylariales sp. No.14919]|nr:hypothetical protein ANO14919_093160 [Xylariales sp. No.14919]
MGNPQPIESNKFPEQAKLATNYKTILIQAPVS